MEEHASDAGRPTVALVSVYFSLFDEQMPAGFRESREAVARLYADVLARDFEVVSTGLLASDGEARRANAALRGCRLDAVVFAPTMAAPPSYAAHALEGLGAPVVIWNAPMIERLSTELSQAEATVNSTQVGCVMLANALVRQARPFATVTASPGDADAMARLVRTVRAAAAASALRGAVALRVGDPIPGYIDVEASGEELARLGVREQPVSVEELNDAFALAEPARGEGWRGAADERSLRLAAAMRTLVELHGAVCGTVNCHGPYLRGNARIGISACFGVSLLTEGGVPFSCTGDQPTALALLLARRISGRALYCEFYTPELETGLMLLAAGGEGDPAWADRSAPVLVEPNHHYPGEHGAGASLAFRLEPGPATVLSLSPADDGWRLAWATGEILETRYDRMGGPNAMFRFDSGPSDEAGARWIGSGATHHNALAAGRLDVEIPVVAEALGVTAVRV